MSKEFGLLLRYSLFVFVADGLVRRRVVSACGSGRVRQTKVRREGRREGMEDKRLKKGKVKIIDLALNFFRRTNKDKVIMLTEVKKRRENKKKKRVTRKKQKG